MHHSCFHSCSEGSKRCLRHLLHCPCPCPPVCRGPFTNHPLKWSSPCIHAGRHAQAYEKALSLQPSRLHSLVQLGLLHLALGSFSEAAQALSQALEVHPTFPPAMLGLGSAMHASAQRHLGQGCSGGRM